MKARWWIASVISDVRLSMDARGLLCWLGTRPAGWRYGVEECLFACGWGRQKFQKVLREVKTAGWAETSYKRDGEGRIKFTYLKLHDKPSRKAENQPSGKPVQKDDPKASGPRAENQPRLKNSINRAENLATDDGSNVVAFMGRAAHA